MTHIELIKTNPKSIIGLLLGSMILAIGVNLFIAPHNLAFGGVTGLTIIAQSLTGLPISVSNLILSVFVIFLGGRILGREFLVKTIIPTIIIPFFLFITAPLSKFAPSLPISAICGAMTVGIGVSFTMLAGGSTAGPDTVGLVLNKRFGIPITLTMLIIDISVILCGFRVYGIWTAAWSVCVAIVMNITVKLVKDSISEKIIFRYWHKHTSVSVPVPKL